MTSIQGTAIIRNRGQLTIPDKIRGSLNWLETNTVVSIKTISATEIIIKPYTQEQAVDWVKIEADIRKLRTYKGAKGSMSEFIAEDRYRH